MNPANFRLAPAIWLPVAIALIAWAIVLGAALQQVGTVYPGFRVNRVATVWITNEPHLPGIRAGLQPGDVVQRIDGAAMIDGPAVRAAVRARPAGTPVAYEIRRDGAPQTFSVPATPLDPLDFLLSFAVRFGTALATIAIGLAAAAIRPGNRAARANLLFCVGWGLFTVLDVDFELTYLFHPALYYGAVLLYAGGALAMALNFPETPGWLQARPQHQASPYMASVLAFVPIAAAFALQGVGSGVEVGEIIGTAWPSLVLLFGFGLFVYRLRQADNPRTRTQLQVLLLGLAVAYLPYALLANLPILVTGHAPPPAVLAATSALYVVFPLAIAYAIVRHGLFDIAIIVKRTTTYAVLTACLIGGYFLAAGAIRWAAALLGLAQGSDWQNALATALIAVLVMPVRSLISRTVDRLFFRTDYDFRDMVSKVTSKAQNTLDLAETMRTFAAVIDEALHPRFMYILTLEPGGRALRADGPNAVYGDVPDPGLRVFLDDPLLARTESIDEVEYVPATGLTGLLSPLAALGSHYRVPLQVGEEVVGLIVLGPKRSDQDYAAEDRELLAATRLPLATAIKTATLVDDKLFKDRVEQDLRRAREVQQAMLPAELPVVAGYQFAASSIACYEASGDYYDFVELADGRLGVAVADVAGKGIAAALATAMAKSGLYNQTQTDPEVLPVLHALNRLLHAVTKRAVAKSFTTCVYAVLEPEARKLTYACAGHFAPLHWSGRAGRTIEYPIIGGFPLGVRDKAKYLAQDVALGPGDILVFYSDGVTEAQAPDDLPRGGDVEPGEQFESDRLADVVRTHAAEPAQVIHDAICAAVAAFVAGGPQTDDITLVVIKVADA